MSDFFIIAKPSAVWTAENPSMPPNYLGVESLIVDGVETEDNKAKLFNGIDAWNDLDYWSPGGTAAGDVVGPASATDNGIATFDGITGKLIQDGVMTLPAASGIVGYLESPINSQSGDYTTLLTDSGKTILETGATKTITIDSNAHVAYPLGTCLSFICTNATGCSIAITTDTMTLANSTTTGTRTLAQNGRATAQKMTSTTWLISGVGLT